MLLCFCIALCTFWWYSFLFLVLSVFLLSCRVLCTQFCFLCLHCILISLLFFVCIFVPDYVFKLLFIDNSPISFISTNIATLILLKSLEYIFQFNLVIRFSVFNVLMSVKYLLILTFFNHLYLPCVKFVNH